jgi:hypothetical protein
LALLNEFERLTGSAVLVNTSFNIRGEPIVCSPEDGYRCFLKTEMDALVMGHFLLIRSEQPQTAVEGADRVLVEELEKVAPTVSHHGPKLKEEPAEWRKFAAVWTAALSLVLYKLTRNHQIAPSTSWPLEALVLALLATALLKPRLARTPYRWVMTATHYIGRPMSKILLSLFFLLGITPFGLIMRLLGKTPLEIHLDPKTTSYWLKPGVPRGFRRPS